MIITAIILIIAVVGIGLLNGNFNADFIKLLISFILGAVIVASALRLIDYVKGNRK